MSKNKFELIPDYKFVNTIRKLLLTIALVLMVSSVLLWNGLYAILSVSCLVVASILPKKFLRVDAEKIIIETHYLFKAINDSDLVKIDEIREVFFVRKNFTPINLFASGHVVDYEDRKVFNQDKIVINFKNKKRSKVIYKIGQIDEFMKAFYFIRSKVEGM
ncbi:hypothetical protein N9164_13710 [Draconibacterium sp.]|nr:hypothetical protein [Draconibacterium sp.]